MHINKWELTAASLLLIALGGFAGAIMQEMQATRELVLQPLKITPSRSTIRFDAIENGILRGRVDGAPLALLVADSEVTVLPTGEFSAVVTPILPNLKIIPHPSDAQFVASRLGKYFWPLDSLGAAQINWKNRQFFDDRAQAEKAGFVRGK